MFFSLHSREESGIWKVSVAWGWTEGIWESATKDLGLLLIQVGPLWRDLWPTITKTTIFIPMAQVCLVLTWTGGLGNLSPSPINMASPCSKWKDTCGWKSEHPFHRKKLASWKICSGGSVPSSMTTSGFSRLLKETQHAGEVACWPS